MSEITIYEGASGEVEVRVQGGTLWLSLQQIADLFGRDKSVISRYLRNIFKDGELDRDSVVAKNATTATDGKTYQVEQFNLDAIISVGYRVNSVAGILYFVVKNHPFADGNKRSGAFLFVDFLGRNARLLNDNDQPVINDTGLAALTLLVAESKPDQKDTLIRLIMHMLAGGRS